MIDVIGTEMHRARSEANICVQTSPSPSPVPLHATLNGVSNVRLVTSLYSTENPLTFFYKVSTEAPTCSPNPRSKGGISNISFVSFQRDLACSCLFSLARTRTSHTVCYLSLAKLSRDQAAWGGERRLYRYRMPIC